MMYEYIPQSIEKWFHGVMREFIENYEQRLILFSRYLADKAIILTFRRENMGVTEAGDPKYYLDTNFLLDPALDRLALKKKYKEEIRQLIQYYIDKKNAIKPPAAKPLGSEKKENSKVLKILEAIEKGKANLFAETPKDNLALVSPQHFVAENKNTIRPVKNMNIQNIFIQKEVNKVNKIQVMVGNKPVEVLQEEFKREYASSSFYINGVPTIKLEREGEARRLFSPTDKLTRFEEVKYKEYKTIKTSGEVYVQDFISVLEADDAEKLTLPGSPRGTLHGYSPRAILHSPPKMAIKMISGPAKQLSIEPELKRDAKKETKPFEMGERVNTPRNNRAYPQCRQFLSEKEVKNMEKEEPSTKGSPISDFKPCTPSAQLGSTKTFELQKKVS
jgi:hypothetical protein